MNNIKAYYHLPGLFEFVELYKKFLPLFFNHKEYFYDWCEIGSIYGAPSDCLWGGGRIGFGDSSIYDVYDLTRKYNISARLTFSNSLLKEEHLNDAKCNYLCKLFNNNANIKNGIIIYSDLLLNYIKNKYPNFYFVSSTTKVILSFEELLNEIRRDDYDYVVPDYRLNKEFIKFEQLTSKEKEKIEFLCNECCDFSCQNRKKCYENVSRKSLGEDCLEHVCTFKDTKGTYSFSKAKENPGFISIEDIKNVYLPKGFSNFKIEGRSLGSAIVLEFLLYYMVKPQYQINVREEIYLYNSLDLF